MHQCLLTELHDAVHGLIGIPRGVGHKNVRVVTGNLDKCAAVVVTAYLPMNQNLTSIEEGKDAFDIRN